MTAGCPNAHGSGVVSSKAPLRAAAEKLPVARYGSVEVRPLMSDEYMQRYRDTEAAAEA